MKKYRIGIDVGATNTKIGLFDRDMNLLDSTQTLTDPEADLPMLMDFIESLVQHMLKRSGISSETSATMEAFAGTPSGAEAEA